MAIRASEYHIDDAADLLAVVTAIQDALDKPQDILTRITWGRNNLITDEVQASRVDDLYDAGAALHKAQEQANAIVGKAHTTAEDVLTLSRSEANPSKTDIVVFMDPHHAELRATLLPKGCGVDQMAPLPYS